MSQNYKETLNLPRTEFPMKANLAAREPEMLKMWEETRLYQQIQKSREGRELFVLHDGPPFANGDVSKSGKNRKRSRENSSISNASNLSGSASSAIGRIHI